MEMIYAIKYLVLAQEGDIKSSRISCDPRSYEASFFEEDTPKM